MEGRIKEIENSTYEMRISLPALSGTGVASCNRAAFFFFFLQKRKVDLGGSELQSPATFTDEIEGHISGPVSGDSASPKSFKKSSFFVLKNEQKLLDWCKDVPCN